MTPNCDIGLIGLAVMGENLALNIESRGFKIAVYNRTTSKVDDLLAGRAKGKNFVGCHSLEELVGSLAVPRKVMLMVKAGPAVDEFIEKLIPLLPARRRDHRRRQYALQRHRAAHEVRRIEGAALRRHRRLRRRGRGAEGPEHDARRKRGRLAAGEADLSGDLGQGRARTATSPAANGSARAGRAITSKWSTTASSTATCS